MPLASRRVGLAYANAGIPLVRLGPPPRPGDLGQSAYLRDVLNDTSGDCPRLDLKLEKRSGDLVRRAINAGWVEACHDVAEGGLLVAVSEMALASHMGADISRLNASVPAYFGEPCATYILAVPEPALILAEVSHQGLKAEIIGVTGGDAVRLSDHQSISLDELSGLHEGFLPAYMGE